MMEVMAVVLAVALETVEAAEVLAITVKILASAATEAGSEAAVDLEMEVDTAAGEAWVVVPSTLYT